MIQGILKPMPDYGAHFIAGVEITTAGRAFVVDDREVDAAFAHHEKMPPDKKLELVTTRLRGQQHSDAFNVYQPCKSGIEHERNAEGKSTRAVPYKIYDAHDAPLLLSTAAYEMIFRPVFGRLLICEPVGGPIGGSETVERMAALEEEAAHARAREQETSRQASARIVELEDELERTREGNRAGMSELDKARARIAELEAAAAAGAKAPAKK